MKSKLIKNNEVNSRQAKFSGTNEINFLSQVGDLKELKHNNCNESSRINFKRDHENNFESLILKSLVDNLFEYVSEQNNKENKNLILIINK